MWSAVRPALTSLEESTRLILAAGWGWAAVPCARPQCLWTGSGIDWCPGSRPRPCRCCWHCWCWRWSLMKNTRKAWKWSSPWASRGTGSRPRKGSPSGWCARDAEWWRTVGRNRGHRSGYSSWHGCWTTRPCAVGREEREKDERRKGNQDNGRGKRGKTRKKGKKISLYVTTVKQSEWLLSQSPLTATKVYSAKMEMQKKRLVSKGRLYLQFISKTEEILTWQQNYLDWMNHQSKISIMLNNRYVSGEWYDSPSN